MIDHPYKPQQRWQYDCRYMVDGKADAGGGGNICWVGDLLEIGLDCYRHGKEHMVQQIQCDRKFDRVHKGVADEDNYQPNVFER